MAWQCMEQHPGRRRRRLTKPPLRHGISRWERMRHVRTCCATSPQRATRCPSCRSIEARGGLQSHRQHVQHDGCSDREGEPVVLDDPGSGALREAPHPNSPSQRAAARRTRGMRAMRAGLPGSTSNGPAQLRLLLLSLLEGGMLARLPTPTPQAHCGKTCRSKPHASWPWRARRPGARAHKGAIEKLLLARQGELARPRCGDRHGHKLATSNVLSLFFV